MLCKTSPKSLPLFQRLTFQEEYYYPVKTAVTAVGCCCDPMLSSTTASLAGFRAKSPINVRAMRRSETTEASAAVSGLCVPFTAMGNSRK